MSILRVTVRRVVGIVELEGEDITKLLKKCSFRLKKTVQGMIISDISRSYCLS